MEQNPYERLLDECAYEIVTALVRGVPVRDAMHRVFSMMYAYFKDLDKSK